MITDKFVGIVDKVITAVETRNLNDGFDEIIEEANINYEREVNRSDGESGNSEGAGRQGDWPQSTDF